MLKRSCVFIFYIVLLHIVCGFRPVAILKTNKHIAFRNVMPINRGRKCYQLHLVNDEENKRVSLSSNSDISTNAADHSSRGSDGGFMTSWSSIKGSIMWLWKNLQTLLFSYIPQVLLKGIQIIQNNHSTTSTGVVENNLPHTSPTHKQEKVDNPQNQVDQLTTSSPTTTKFHHLLDLFAENRTTTTSNTNTTKELPLKGTIPLPQHQQYENNKLIGNFADSAVHGGSNAQSMKSTRTIAEACSKSSYANTDRTNKDTTTRTTIPPYHANSNSVYDTMRYVLENSDAFVSFEVMRMAAADAQRTSSIPTPTPREYEEEEEEDSTQRRRIPRDDDEDDGDDDEEDDYDDEDELTDDEFAELEGRDELRRKESLDKVIRKLVQVLREEGLTITKQQPEKNNPMKSEVNTVQYNSTATVPPPSMTLQHFQSLGPKGMIAYILTELSCWSLYPMLVKVFATPPSSDTIYLTVQEREQVNAQYTAKLFIVSTLFIMSMLSTEELRFTLANRLLKFIDTVVVPQLSFVQPAWLIAKKALQDWLEQQKQKFKK